MEKTAALISRYKRNFLFRLLFWKGNFAADNRKKLQLHFSASFLICMSWYDGKVYFQLI